MYIAISIAAAALLMLVVLKGLAIASARMHVPVDLTAEGRLPACDSTDNCLCTEPPYATADAQPLPYLDTPRHTRDELARMLRNMPRVTIVSQTDNTLHATATTPLLGFVDDMLFRFDDDARLVHCRFASRVGKSDMGANAERFARLRQVWPPTASH